MNPELSTFAARLRIGLARSFGPANFDQLALELFSLQFAHNSAYQTICAARGLTPQVIKHWTQIPAVPTLAFKEMELTSLLPAERTNVFHSSGTTEQKPSRHFHSPESLALYETSLWSWFEPNVGSGAELVFLTPSPQQAPHSSLIHMFETVRRKLRLSEAAFLGKIAGDGVWALDMAAVVQRIQLAVDAGQPVTLLGTAFSFVHLLDHLAENNLLFHLPDGSRVMETGGYKNRSRTMPKAELHALIIGRLGVSPENIICEYGMSELSSQAYDGARPGWVRSGFHFPPWARAQIISPENGSEVAEGETGLIRVFDLANVYSVMAVQTEDLAVRRGDGFELVGRAQLAEPRGCSLMAA